MAPHGAQRIGAGQPVTAAQANALLERPGRIAEELLLYVEGAIAVARVAEPAPGAHQGALQELLEIHSLLRRRALATDPQGQLM